jgi:hypothetical protein
MNTNPEVDVWFKRYDNPQKALVQAVRETILKADNRVTETIKWQAPTFVYKGNIASFFPKTKTHASLMFHKGATIPGRFPSLEGEGKEGRTMRFTDMKDLKAKAAELKAVVKAWCDQQDA